MERAPYIYQLVMQHGGPMPSKEERRVLEKERWQSPESWRYEGCNWDEQVLHEGQDQAEIGEAFSEAVRNVNAGKSKHVRCLYVRRLGYPGRIQEWVRPDRSDERMAGLPDTEPSAQPRADVKGEKRSGP